MTLNGCYATRRHILGDVCFPCVCVLKAPLQIKLESRTFFADSLDFAALPLKWKTSRGRSTSHCRKTVNGLHKCSFMYSMNNYSWHPLIKVLTLCQSVQHYCRYSHLFNVLQRSHKALIVLTKWPQPATGWLSEASISPRVGWSQRAAVRLACSKAWDYYNRCHF